MSLRWQCSDGVLEFGPAISFGIVNVTTDSMYSGARSGTPEQAIADGKRLFDGGFGFLDAGAVAARSGAPVPPETEAEALVPTVRGLVELGAKVSADTFSPVVAEAALEAGATIVNDISGGNREMFELIGDRGAGYVLMHIEGPPREDRPPPKFDDVIEYLRRWFAERIDLAVSCGMHPEQIVVDPGLDFDLSVEDNLRILDRLNELKVLGRPIYLSLSRKDFLGAVSAGSWRGRWPAEARGPATISATTIGALNGANIHRLHDVEALEAVRLVDRIDELEG